jgi:hypothetical protein
MILDLGYWIQIFFHSGSASRIQESKIAGSRIRIRNTGEPCKRLYMSLHIKSERLAAFVETQSINMATLLLHLTPLLSVI